MDESDTAKAFSRLLRVAGVLALIVIMLGAYVRLSDAGLGCPDWPGCYGHLVGVPQTGHELQAAGQNFPQRAVETGKAWKEVIHRYFAGTLGVLILALAVTAWRNRRRRGQPLAVPILLAGLVILQALLGMWTVTLQLKPLIVLAHLLGGFAILSLLWWLYLQDASWSPPNTGLHPASRGLYAAALLGAVIVIGQIALGGWTSSNYAALACTDFPTCQQQWWPSADFAEGFIPWQNSAVNYEYGVLDNPGRTAIHLTHRLGALVTLAYLTALALSVVFRRRHGGRTRVAGAAVLALAYGQVALGISNVVFHLPLPVAVAHNAGAALLLLAVITLGYMVKYSGNPSSRPLD